MMTGISPPSVDRLNELKKKYPAPPLSGRKYHAFIAHSSEDRDTVDHLIKTLESGQHFRCFAYSRDLAPGSSIVSGVVKAIDESRRTILVVTKTFLESGWSVFEAVEAMQKGYSENQMVLVPVLHGVKPDELPSYLKNIIAIETTERDFWPRLFMALVEKRPTTALIPAGNVAHGLAWSYFYGYLNFVLPGLAERCHRWAVAKSLGLPILPKMLILLPESCKCPEKIEDVDNNFSFIGHIEFNASRAGNRERSYKSSVYRVRNPDTDEEYLFIAEFATPLMSMWEMEEGQLAGLNKEQKFHQMKLFKDKLQEILDHSKNAECHNKYTLLQYTDTVIDGNSPDLAGIVAQHIKNNLTKEEMVRQLSDTHSAPTTPEVDTSEHVTSALGNVTL